MNPSPPDEARPGPLSAEEAERLVGELGAEMTLAWRRGDRLPTEDLLARHPGLWEHPASAADLIYEELCLRQELGAEMPAEHVLRRFPRWRPQLEVLLACQRILDPVAGPSFPEPGEALGEFRLLAELGRGAHGRVYLASQRPLGDRPVVLKLMPSEAREDLSLARLQHTHIVPLYSAEDHPARALRALCMPYFGGATLAELLDATGAKEPSRRTGQDLIDALDRLQSRAPLSPPAGGPARRALAAAPYAEAICQVGACLADALGYAHERGLVHLDLKPSNVLLAADGQPMLLDFHLARAPIGAGVEAGVGGPQALGGTHGYMSPEQQEALAALQKGKPAPRPVDGRSDIYSLGVVLHEALGGARPAPEGSPSLRSLNPKVSPGLSDIIARCLAPEPDARYPRMADLAADLRRHLAHLPLAGVRNRSLPERWEKWRRRRPHGVALAGMAAAVLTASGAVAAAAAGQLLQRIEQARSDLEDGQLRLAGGDPDGAIRALRRGLDGARGLPFARDLADDLGSRLRLAERRRDAVERDETARELRRLADRVRFLHAAEWGSREALRGVEAACRTFWGDRERIARRLAAGEGRALDSASREDLLDLAIFWAALLVRQAPPDSAREARRQALEVLDQAEASFGPSVVLDEERRAYGAPGPSPARGPQTPWEHYALARTFLRSGDLNRAAEEAGEAVARQPQGLWPNFYQGLCSYRLGRHDDAVAAYSVCIGAAPGASGGFYNRALAFEALGRNDRALEDYDEALRLDPALAAAALNRGMLHHREGRHARALADLERAGALGADPSAVSYDLALVYLALGRRADAVEALRRALALDPGHPGARALGERLIPRDGGPSPDSAPPPPGQFGNSAPGPGAGLR